MRKMMYLGEMGFVVYLWIYKAYRFLKFDHLSDEEFIRKRFFVSQGYPINLSDPKSLNEKLNWLKIHDRKDFHAVYADKFRVRDFIANRFGEDLLIPLVLITEDYKEIVPEKLPDYPFIIKATHDSGSYLIVKEKSEINWNRAQVDCRFWISRNYYYNDREWQYKSLQGKIIVEKLLTDENGKIPNDYKLNCINGKVEFIYVSVDREGKNKRNIYDKNWNPLPFTWANRNKDISHLRGEEIQPPATLARMILISEEIASKFPYVRVDFYDLNGKLFFGEITQCHGGGFDRMLPLEWDYKYGELLKLPV